MRATRRRPHQLRYICTLAAAVLALAPALAAGPQDVGECETLDESGTYVLKNDVEAEGDCFVIDADFVTLDLNGFTISGNGTGDGVTDDEDAHTGVTVKNGTITNFFDGIRLVDTDAVTIEHVNVIDNQRHGINIDCCVVRHCNALFNDEDGIRCGAGCTITNNVANNNGDDGIAVGLGNNIVHNVARDNDEGGLKVACPSNIIENAFTINRDSIDFEDQSLCNLHENLTDN